MVGLLARKIEVVLVEQAPVAVAGVQEGHSSTEVPLLEARSEIYEKVGLSI